jgi:hypothetical protein
MDAKKGKVIGRGQGMDLGFGSAGIAGSLIGREGRGRRGLRERDFCFKCQFLKQCFIFAEVV